MLQASHITVRLSGKIIVDDVSLTLKENELLMLIGPNGAGKSTLLRALSGAVPCSGRIVAGGQDLSSLRPVQIARKLGLLMQQNKGNFDYTVEEIVRLGCYAARTSPFSRSSAQSEEHKIQHALMATDMLAFRNTRMLSLSGGEVQRAFLAQVFAQDPDILMLDEPANHLDLVCIRQIFQLINAWRKKPGKAVLCVMHDLSLARYYADRIALMDKGRLLKVDAPGALFTSPFPSEAYHMDVTEWMQEISSPWLK